MKARPNPADARAVTDSDDDSASPDAQRRKRHPKSDAQPAAAPGRAVIAETMLKEAMEITGAKTKRDAIVPPVADFNRRVRLAALVRQLGSCDNLISPAELVELRETP